VHYTSQILQFLYDKFGKDVAEAVRIEFGGDSYYIAKTDKKIDEKQAIIEDNWGVMSTRDIAKLTGLTTRSVQRRLNRPHSGRQRPIEKIQGVLFS
jgi:hypothetical protein